MIKLSRIGEPNPIKSTGMKDGEEVLLKCSNCNKECASFKITRPSMDFSWRIRASCAFGCKKDDNSEEMSFPLTINGTGHYGPCFKVNPNNPDDIVMTTQIIDIKTEIDSIGEIQTFYTKSV